MRNVKTACWLVIDRDDATKFVVFYKHCKAWVKSMFVINYFSTSGQFSFAVFHLNAFFAIRRIQ